MEVLRDLRHLLVPWKDILGDLIDGRESKPAKKLPWCESFIDGMEFAAPTTLGPSELRTLLKNKGINAAQPSSQRSPGHQWIQLADAPWDLAYNLPRLQQATEYIRSLIPIHQIDEPADEEAST